MSICKAPEFLRLFWFGAVVAIQSSLKMSACCHFVQFFRLSNRFLSVPPLAPSLHEHQVASYLMFWRCCTSVLSSWADLWSCWGQMLRWGLTWGCSSVLFSWFVQMRPKLRPPHFSRDRRQSLQLSPASQFYPQHLRRIKSKYLI